MSIVDAGMLRRRVRLQRPVMVKDTLGAPTHQWVEVATVWADLQPLSGREAVIGGRISAEISHQITVRYQHIFDNPGQVAQMRALYGQRIFNIHAALSVLMGNRHGLEP